MRADFRGCQRDVLGKLLEACNELSRDAVVCAAVVTGTEKCFAAGAELTEIAELDGASAIEFAALGQVGDEANRHQREAFCRSDSRLLHGRRI